MFQRCSLNIYDRDQQTKIPSAVLLGHIFSRTLKFSVSIFSVPSTFVSYIVEFNKFLIEKQIKEINKIKVK